MQSSDAVVSELVEVFQPKEDGSLFGLLHHPILISLFFYIFFFFFLSLVSLANLVDSMGECPEWRQKKKNKQTKNRKKKMIWETFEIKFHVCSGLAVYNYIKDSLYSSNWCVIFTVTGLSAKTISFPRWLVCTYTSHAHCPASNISMWRVRGP